MHGSNVNNACNAWIWSLNAEVMLRSLKEEMQDGCQLKEDGVNTWASFYSPGPGELNQLLYRPGVC